MQLTESGAMVRFGVLPTLLSQLLWLACAIGDEVQWSELSSGLARARHVVVYDSRDECLWLYGGISGIVMDDLWKFDLQTQVWSERTPSTSIKPPAMNDHRMLFDGHHNALWLLGPDDGHGLWTLELGTMRWSQPIAASSTPRVSFPAVVYDSRSVALWLHGGWKLDGGGVSGDLLRLDLQNLEWNETALASTSKPSARSSHAMVYDSSRHELWLHGGYIDATNVRLSDLWNLKLASMTWQQVSVTGPAQRFEHPMVYDSRSDALWLHGGVGYNNVILDDLWKLDLGQMKWGKLDFDVKPVERWGHGMVFDPVRDALYLHGGLNGGVTHLHDLWKLDRVTTTATFSRTSSTVTTSSFTITSTTLSVVSTTTTKTEARPSASAAWGFLFQSSGAWTLQAFAAYLVVTAGACCGRFLWRLQDVQGETRGEAGVPGRGCW